ncbi:MAG: type II toxin-antitoxin system PemK/MazF family toxin [bacterium]
MEKDFDAWNILKQQLDKEQRNVFANKREIWWCSFGLNIGTELYGKHELFERPVLVLKVYNKNTIKVVPLTSKNNGTKYFTPVTLGDITSYASLAHVRTISTNRLSRKVGRISTSDFLEIMMKYKNSI